MRAMPLQFLHQMEERFVQSGGIPTVFSEYMPPTTRKRLEEAGISGMDTTGWVRIFADDPIVLIDRPGANRAPQIRNETIERFTGPSTSRVLRYLATAPVPLGVRQIAQECRVSPGTVAKLLPTLEREDIVRRAPRGPVEAIRRVELIERWAQDYDFIKGNRRVLTLMDPRGVDHTLKYLSQVQETIVTGVHAGRAILPSSVTPVVPGKRLMLYATDPYAIAGQLDVIPVVRGKANIIIASPLDPDLLLESWHSKKLGLRVAPVGQVLVDLKSLPGRESDLADQIMEVFSSNDPTWISGTR